MYSTVVPSQSVDPFRCNVTRQIPLKNLNNDLEGFESIGQIWADLQDERENEIALNARNVSWLSGEMCAALGALMHRVELAPNRVEIKGMGSTIRNALRRNRFLTVFGIEPKQDSWKTTVPYRQFTIYEVLDFSNYALESLVTRNEMPDMTEPLRRRIIEQFCELFENAVSHSETEFGIHSCGQYYRTKQRLNFVLVDMGIGIPASIGKKYNDGLPFASPEEAIKWATEGANTSRMGSIPGGLGLKLLRKFIDLNGGEIQIASDYGYWRLSVNGEQTRRLKTPFPGTAVSVSINTADRKKYSIAE